MAEPGPVVGDRLEIDVGGPVHGGACLARVGDTAHGRVVFVRHALPGERVVAQVTEARGGYLRADAVRVLVAAAGRVEPPCPHAGPGRCGGCDWQHASGALQRELKAAVIREQFARLGGLDVAEVFAGVEALPGGLLGWRTRIDYAVDATGRAGLRRHRCHDVEPIDRCPLGVPGVGDAAALARRWPRHGHVEVARGTDGEPAVLAYPRSGSRRTRRRPDHMSGPARLAHRVGARELTVSAGGFWQVHPGALPAIAAAVRDALRPRPGERAVDLYAGAGALTLVLADAVGERGRVVGVESDAQAVSDAAANLSAHPWATVRRARVDPRSIAAAGPRADIVVLDPPRAGAGPTVMAALLALAPRAVCYVSCEPSTLARDVAAATGAGWRLAGLRALDAFPMTQHVECVALLEPHGCRPG